MLDNLSYQYSRVDDIVRGIKKKQAPRSTQPLKPTIEQEGDADAEQVIPGDDRNGNFGFVLNEILVL